MSSKVFRTIAYYIMTKSQYTDNITGDVLVDLRGLDNKYIVDMTSYTFLRKSNLGSEFSISSGKFSDKCLSFPMTSAGSGITNFSVYFEKSVLLGYKYTISFWLKATQLPSLNSGQNGSYAYTGSIFVYDDNGPNWFFAANNIAKNSGSFYKLATGYNNNWTNEATVNHSSVALNFGTFEHYALIVDNTNIKVYKNGTLLTSINTLSSAHNTKKLSINLLNQINTNIGISNANCYLDDLVIINNQLLWTSNFTVPNYYLTGDHTINRLYKRSILFPTPSSNNDYFDKAFIY